MGTTGFIILWAVAFVFFLICELATSVALVSIWLAIAAIVSMFCAMAKLSFLVQFIVFIVSSIILLIITRPLAKKLQGKFTPTNYELDVGKNAVVVEDINNAINKGRVKLDGTYWSARTADGNIVQTGSVVTVIKVDGTKLIVK